jgi:adenine-specific DNA-methyltransferase
MVKHNMRLELTWIGKESRPKLEPRILIEEANYSYHAERRVSEDDLFDNRLIFGDNLLALKALEQEFAGKIKCICIDPPYNTGSAFTHYDDGIEHSLWLSLMRDRLEILRRLLAPDGSIWIIIDDNEAQYLKVMCDEIFGRGEFIGCIVWQHSVQGKNDAKLLSLHHNYLLAYRRSSAFVRNLLPRTERHNVNYGNPDNDPRGPWRSGDVRSPHLRENLKFAVATPSGKTITPPEKGWRWSKETFAEKVATGEISFVDNETRVLRKIYLSEQDGRVPESIWMGDEAGTTREAASEVSAVTPPSVEPFSTPKPERLIHRILTLASDPGDMVLDSFAGSGTTGAVAHKMGRQWIMVELGEHCHTHIIPRMKKVIDGEDQGGISKAVNWKGGGGFRYHRLGPTLIVEDEWGNPVINKEFNPGMLAEAMCKLEAFTFAPNAEVYWQHGRSSETDFIYVSTQMMTKEMLTRLSDEVGPSRSLLVCCSAFRCDATQFENLTVKKIPRAVLKKCEWGHDDYSLEIMNLPSSSELMPQDLGRRTDEGEPMDQGNTRSAVRKSGKSKDGGPSLFDLDALGSKGDN